MTKLPKKPVQHKTRIEKYDGTLETLAEELGNLRYDTLADFLNLLSAKLSRDGQNDFSKRRVKLASCLQMGSVQLSQASVTMDEAWTICAPYCQDK